MVMIIVCISITRRAPEEDEDVEAEGDVVQHDVLGLTFPLHYNILY